MIAQLNRHYVSLRPAKILPRLLSYFFYEGRPATTRGRWFNPVTFQSLRLASGHRVIPESESPVFITGTGRSGSTLLGLVLSMHPETAFLNEPKALWYLANPTDDIIGSYSKGDAKYIMEAGDADPGTGQKVKSMYSSFLHLTRSKRIVDKYPEMIFRLELLNSLFKNPRYIFLYRDPMETISSTTLWSRLHNNEARHEDWWGVGNRKWNLLVNQVIPFDPLLSKSFDTVSRLTRQTDKAAVEWIATMNYGLKMMDRYPADILPVKYEDFCQHPETTLKEICEFTGLKNESVFQQFGREVIQPATTKEEPDIHPVLQDAIASLSIRLGYPVQSVSMSVTE